MSSSSSSSKDDEKAAAKKSRRPSSSSVGDAFGRIWECYCAFLSFFLSLSLSFASPICCPECFPKKNARSLVLLLRLELTFLPSRRRRRRRRLLSLERPTTNNNSAEIPIDEILPLRRDGLVRAVLGRVLRRDGSKRHHSQTTARKKKRGQPRRRRRLGRRTTRVTKKSGRWQWKRWRRREDEREIRAFERAWEIVDPAVAKASWTRRYGDVFLFDDDDDDDDSGTDNK